MREKSVRTGESVLECFSFSGVFSHRIASYWKTVCRLLQEYQPCLRKEGTIGFWFLMSRSSLPMHSISDKSKTETSQNQGQANDYGNLLPVFSLLGFQRADQTSRKAT